MKNKILATALIISLPIFLTGCVLQELPVIGKYFPNVSVPNPLNTSADLSVWGVWESPEVMDELIAKFNEKYPDIRITYEDRSVMSVDDYKERVTGRLQEGSAADVILVHNTWVKELSSSLSPASSRIMDAGTYRTTFYEVAYESGVVNGEVVAVPAYYDGLALLYNKEHFDEIDQVTPPTAWEEFRRVAGKLTIRDDDGNLVRAGAAIGSARNIAFAPDILGLMFSQAGVVVPDNLDTRSAQDALAFYTSFLTTDGVWSSDFEESLTAFAKGEVSMIFAPSWALQNVMTNNMDLKIGVAPVPQAVEDNPANWASFWMYAVSGSTSESGAAWEFVKFMSEQETQLAYFDAASKVRNFGPIFSRVDLKDQLLQGPSSSMLGVYLESAPTASSSIFTARSGNEEAEEAIRTAIEAVILESRGNSTEGMEPSEALQVVKGTLTQ